MSTLEGFLNSGAGLVGFLCIATYDVCTYIPKSVHTYICTVCVSVRIFKCILYNIILICEYISTYVCMYAHIDM